MTRKAIISGVYDTKVGKLPGSSVMSLHAEAALGAVADAGLDLSDIDGVLCGYALTEPHMMMSSVLCEYLGIQPGYSVALQVGGATGCIMLMQAASLVQGGTCRHVLIMAGENRLTGFAQGGAVAALAAFGHPQFEVPYGVTVPACYALVAQNYMHECGATLDHLGAIAVTARRHASMNPKAHMREPITLEDVSASRIISSPLRLFDCCLISDGAAAVVVSAGEAAPDIKKRPLEILGTGQGHTHEHIFAAPSLTEFGCKQAARTAFARAGLKPADIDVAEIYDSFTITLLIELESMGFFERGEAGPAALEGRLGYDGSLPCNTHGGLLSYGHAGVAGGMFHIVEAARQLRGEGGACQVKDPEVAFVHGDGGILSAHCSVILGRG